MLKNRRLSSQFCAPFLSSVDSEKGLPLRKGDTKIHPNMWYTFFTMLFYSLNGFSIGGFWAENHFRGFQTTSGVPG